MKLSAVQCRNAAPREKAYKLTDGQGLYLEVMPTGAKYWHFQYRYGGKRPRICFGVYPEVTIQDAREKRDTSRKLLRDGINPAVHNKREKLHRTIAASNTFELIAREWHENKKEAWTTGHAKNVLLRFERDVFPKIGPFPLTDVTPPDLLATIRNIEARGASSLARRTLQNIGRVYRYAIATGRAQSDPSYKLSEALRPVKSTHYNAIEIDELPEFICTLRQNKARLFIHTLYATELLMLTFVRTGELIQATWDEIDFDDRLWRIPADRMKMRRDHLVPLSSQALALLSELRDLSAGRKYVFPHYSDPRKHMSNNTVLHALSAMGYKGRMTGHGFRALAMSSIKEKLGYRHEVIDRQLAHAPTNKVDRAQFLEERTRMMQDWANYVDKCRIKGVEDAR